MCCLDESMVKSKSLLEGWRSPPRGAVMIMTLMCCLDETLFVEVCGVSFMCRSVVVMVFARFSTN
jgi:hypothetical protein